DFQEVPAITHGDFFRLEMTLVVDGLVGLRDDKIFLPVAREVVDLVGDLAVHDLAIWRLDEAEIVDSGIARHRRNEADVRAFRRLNRANAAVMRRMHVADFEAGAIAGETARSKGRKTALVGE